MMHGTINVKYVEAKQAKVINIVFSNFVIVTDFLSVKKSVEFYIGLPCVAVLGT